MQASKGGRVQKFSNFLQPSIIYTREDTNAEWQPLLCARLSTSFQLRLGVVMETALFQGVSAESLLMQMLCQDKIKRLLKLSFVC